MGRRMNYGPRFRSSAVSLSNPVQPHEEPRSRLPSYITANMSPLKRAMAAAKGQGAMKWRQARVGMPGKKPRGPSEREKAEQRLFEIVSKAKEMIEFGLTEIMHLPTPKTKFHHLVNQSLLVDALQQLCRTTRPHLVMPSFKIEHARPLALTTCGSCGAPAVTRDADGEQWCATCAP